MNADNQTRRSIKMRLASAINRCYGKTKRSAWIQHYQNKNIKVFQDWIDDRDKFVDWALCNGYFDGAYLDRINNNDGYFPWNLRFVDKFENSRNRTNVKRKGDLKEAVSLLLKNGFSTYFIKQYFGLSDVNIHMERKEVIE
jgi:hypothetical protein